MVNRYAGPGLLQIPTIGSRDSDAAREREDANTGVGGVTEDVGAAPPLESVHPVIKTQPMQRTIMNIGPIFRRVQIRSL
jgi:hypothetical protein